MKLLSSSVLLAFVLLKNGPTMTQAGAPVPTTWLGGNGVWFDSAKWTNGVPNSSSADVVVDDQAGVDSDISITANVTLGRLRVDSGDTVSIATGVPLFEINDTAFSGAGELLLNGQFMVPDATFFHGPKTLNGTGKFVLGSSPTVRPEITGATMNNATIEGTANFGRVTNNSYPGTIINTGVVNANVPGAGLHFRSAAGSTNTNLIEATNGGLLSLDQGSIINSNTGLILADGANSIAHIGGFAVIGGTLEGKNGGIVRINGATFKDLTIAGTAALTGALLVDGTVTTNGTLNVPGGALVTKVGNTNPVTLAGTGSIVLDGAVDTIPELIDQGNSSVPSISWNFDDVTVRGRGNVGYIYSQGSIDNVTITNQGTFQADVDGQTLLIDVAGFDNRSGGLVRAIGSGSNGGTLTLAINAPFQNTGGTIEALSGGRVEAAFARIEGGLIRNIGGSIPLGNMTLVNPGTGMRLEGDLKLGLAGANQEAFIIGEIENTGILRVSASTHYARLRLGDSPSRTASLTGGGQLILGDPTSTSTESALMEFSTNSQVFTLTNVDNIIRGFGRIGDPNYDRWLAINNTGTITADAPGKVLQMELHSGDNTGGTISATSGGLMRVWSRAGMDNVGGLFESSGPNSKLNFSYFTTVTGGNFRNSGGIFELGYATMVNPGSGFTLQGPFVQNSATDSRFIGNIRNEGSIRLRSESDSTLTRLAIGSDAIPNVTLTGGGEIILGSETPTGSAASIQNAEGAGTTTLTLESQNLRGFGSVGFGYYGDRRVNLINNSLINADVSGKRLTLVPPTLTNNPGKTVKATNGGELFLNPSQIINTGATVQATGSSMVSFEQAVVLDGGQVRSDGGGTVRILRDMTAKGGALFTIAGTLEFGGLGGTTFSGLASGGSSIVNSGTVKKIGSTDYSIFSPLNNAGAIDVQGGLLRWKGGGTVANSALSAASGTYLLFQDVPFTFSGTTSLSGAGKHAIANTTVTLEDAATTLNATNFEFGNLGTSTLTGPGNLNISGGITLHPGPTIITGTQLTTLAGSNSSIAKSNSLLEFNGGANWKNYGTVSMGGYINVLTGDSSTLFTNMLGGIFRATGAQENRLTMPFLNSGEFDIATGSLLVTSSGTFNNGATKVASNVGLYLTGGATITFQGTNNVSTGDGPFGPADGNFAFTTGAKLTGENIGLYFASNLSGVGTLEVTKNLWIGKTYQSPYAPNHNITVTNTLLRVAPTGTASFGVNVSFGRLDLKESAVFENAGRVNHYHSSAIESADGTGIVRTLESSNTFAYSEVNCSAPFDFAGQIYAEQGKTVTFSGGGLFNETAKIWPNHPGSNITFTGSTPFQSRGRAVEFPGTGYVNFVGTTLEFLPSTLVHDRECPAGRVR